MASTAKKAIYVAAVLMCACGAKAFYSKAGSDSLEWLLTPTAYLVEAVSGIAFDNEPGLGWVNGDFGVIIAPSCSGMNYLIMLFCLSTLSAVPKLRSLSALCGWGLISALTAYVSTLSVNSLRIWLAILLYEADIYSVSLTEESVHRVAGVSIYYFFMVFYYYAVSFILNLATGQRHGPAEDFAGLGRIVRFLWPFCCYLIFSVTIPFLRGAASDPHFIGHAQVVVGVSGAMTVLLGLGAGAYCSVFKRYRSLNAGR